MIPKNYLGKLYLADKKSSAEIAKLLSCSAGRIDYWLDAHQIKKRSISDAGYIKHNPAGDPFTYNPPQSLDDSFLAGLGVGLYWGEGNKKNKHAVRLGNSDPRLIRAFLNYLIKIWGIRKEKLRFGLQIFTDINADESLRYWVKELNVPKSAFQKVVVTISGKIGTYREKSKYGVVTLYFNNKKLRDLICKSIDRAALLR